VFEQVPSSTCSAVSTRTGGTPTRRPRSRVGPVSYSRDVHYDDCGKKSDNKLCAGFTRVNLSEPSVSVAAEAELGDESDVDADTDKKSFKPKLSAPATATFGHCMGSKR
jgi:hypothetical protein